MRLRRSKGELLGDIFIYASMWFVVLVALYPFLYVISMSVSGPTHVMKNTVWLWPKGFSLKSYELVFQDADIWLAYYNTFYYTIVGTAINIFMTVLGAYPLSRKSFSARNAIMMFIVFTMFFAGGLIPLFLLIVNLGIYNTRWAILLPTAVSAFLIIITRTFFQSIPEELHESAKLDGAGEFKTLVRIVLPLSMPIVAVLTLFYAVSHWNSFFPAMIYLNDDSLKPVSLFLISVLIENTSPMEQSTDSTLDQVIYGIQMKYALIVITTLPVTVVYPFLQKYFVKGVMIGSLKG